ncbi:MAG: heme o synthase [Endozoicomonas sp. (ex Botrylloides leachii)]|nr:heme o synthase [Endozoicomonas sp. (ex Botrylloides leachii)]
MIRKYIQTIKPGIIFGNIIAALGGFLLGSQGNYSFWLFIAIIFGTAMVIASACIINNYFDRDIDGFMARTKDRYFVHHLPSILWVSFYALLIGLSGFFILYFFANPLAACLALAGHAIYTIIYTCWLKRKSPISTIAGSFSGALPPVIGYCSVTNEWDSAASLLFLLFCCWQMPHHYAISIFRLDDYRAANIPVLPAVIGVPATFRRCVLYIAAFLIISSCLFWAGFTSFYYLVITVAINGWWLFTALQPNDATKKARKLFMQSILVITAHCLLMGLPK